MLYDISRRLLNKRDVIKFLGGGIKLAGDNPLSHNQIGNLVPKKYGAGILNFLILLSFK